MGIKPASSDSSTPLSWREYGVRGRGGVAEEVESVYELEGTADEDPTPVDV